MAKVAVPRFVVRGSLAVVRRRSSVRIDPRRGESVVRSMGVDEQMPNPPSHEGTTSLVDQVFRIWVEPAIDERRTGLTRADVTRALVFLSPTASPMVRINDEVDLMAHIDVARSFDQGEPVAFSDIKGITRLRPSEGESDSGWVALAKFGDEFVIAFDVRRNRKTARLLVERAKELEKAARDSLGEKQLRPAIENGYAAIELAFKAEMYLIDDSPTTIQAKRVTWWSSWVELGKAPNESDAILQRLYRERKASRNGDHPISMSHDEVLSALDRVRSVIEHAQMASTTPTHHLDGGLGTSTQEHSGAAD